MILHISVLPILLLIALLHTPSPASSHTSLLRLRRAHARLDRLHHLILQLKALDRDDPFIHPTDNIVNTEPVYNPIQNLEHHPIINTGDNENPFLHNWSNPGRAMKPDPNGLVGDGDGDGDAPVVNLFGNNWSGNSPVGSIHLANPIDETTPHASTPITDNWRTLFNGEGNDIPSQTIPHDPNSSSNIDPLVVESLAAQRTQLGTSDAAQTPSDLAFQSAAAQQAQGQVGTVDAGQTMPSDLALQSAATQQAQGQNTAPINSFVSSQESRQALEQLAEQQVQTNGNGYII